MSVVGSGAAISAVFIFFSVVGALVTIIGSWAHPRIPEGFSILTGVISLYFGVNLFWTTIVEELQRTLIFGIDMGTGPEFTAAMMFVFGGMTMGSVTAQRL